MNLSLYENSLKKIKWTQCIGSVNKITGLTLECKGISPKVGELCEVFSQKNSNHKILCEVIGINRQISILMPLDELEGIGYGDKVIACEKKITIKVGEFLKGTVLNGYGKPIDERVNISGGEEVEITALTPNPLERIDIQEVFSTGIKAIDTLLTCGKGQRVAIMAGSGVGKSTLLGSLARSSEAKVSVLALIGERGREVKNFIENVLGEKGLAQSIIIAATSDTSCIQRLKGVMTALTIAEYFRDQGNDVLFFCDSITRTAMAIREIGLARGEPPTLRGYPPSLYSTLSKIVERLGTTEKGSITGFFTVLVEGDDFNEPVADTVRSLLDGHIVLDRGLADQAHYPAISIPKSVSRIMNDIISKKHKKAAERFRSLYCTYLNNQELINIGAYKKGTNALIDEAIAKRSIINELLCQDMKESYSYEKSLELLYKIVE